jgi:hypothetical protein
MDVASAGARMHRPRTRVAAVAVVVSGVTVAACTSEHHAPRGTVTDVRTVTATRTAGPTERPTAPVSTGPTIAAAAPSCPWLERQAAADRVGMRLERVTVLRSGGRVVGCRFYALQNSPLHRSEHLPGPHQPAIEITTTRYPSRASAHNAFVRSAQHRHDVEQAAIAGHVGLCFQTAFYSRDKGRDWACTVNLDDTVLAVKTVVVSPALNVIAVSRRIADALRETR